MISTLWLSGAVHKSAVNNRHTHKLQKKLSWAVLVYVSFHWIPWAKRDLKAFKKL